MDLSQYDMESRRMSHDGGDNNVQSSPAPSSPHREIIHSVAGGAGDSGDGGSRGGGGGSRVGGSGVVVVGDDGCVRDNEEEHELSTHTCDVLPSTSVFAPGASSSSQAWSEEPNAVSASICSSSKSLLLCRRLFT